MRPSRARRPAGRLLAVVAALGLLAGCSTDRGSAGPTTGTGEVDGVEAPQGTATSEPDPADPDDPALTSEDDPAQDPSVPVDELSFATCEGDGFSIGYPETWTATEGEGETPCGMFGPGELGAADPGDLSVPVQLHLDPNTSYEEQPDPTDAEVSRLELTIGERQVTRIEAVTPGAGGEPEGVEVTTYRVDLGDQGLLTATTSDLGDTDYERDQEILARMLEELTVP